MKVSELIEFLNGVIDEHGDMYLENEQGVLSTREQWEEAFQVRKVDGHQVTQFDGEIAGKVDFDA